MKRLASGWVVALATACGSSSGGQVACPSNSTLTYDNFGKQFMTSYCITCHASNLGAAARNGAPSDDNYETQALVQQHLTEINDEAGAQSSGAVNTDMPDGNVQPSDAERKQLAEWLACGAR